MKDILIIGGTKGIGLSLTKSLSDSNITVVSKNGLGEAIANVKDVTMDVTADTHTYEGDKLDALIYCPGSINLKPFNRLKEDDFTSDFELNVMGAVRHIQANLDLLKNSENPSITLFSTVAVGQGMPFHASVAASKGAIEGLVRSLAAELAPNVRINAIAPSITNTPLAGKLLSSEDKIEKSGERHPMKRVGRPEDISAMISLLISDQGSWITGQIIGVDGGMSTVRSI